MIRIVTSCLFVFIYSMITTNYCLYAKSEKLPEHIERLVFKNPAFSPIIFQLPPEDSRAGYEKMRQIKVDNSFIPKVYIQTGVVSKVDPNLLKFLIHQGYATMEKTSIKNRFGHSTELKYVFYNNILKKYIINIDEKNPFGNDFYIVVANRHLKSIDYKNEYEGVIPFINAKTMYYAITFTYTLEEKLSGIPQIDKAFSGKAKAYIDPDDGKWKLVDNIELNDSGSQGYINLLSRKYE